MISLRKELLITLDKLKLRLNARRKGIEARLFKELSKSWIC